MRVLLWPGLVESASNWPRFEHGQTLTAADGIRLIKYPQLHQGRMCREPFLLNTHTSTLERTTLQSPMALRRSSLWFRFLKIYGKIFANFYHADLCSSFPGLNAQSQSRVLTTALFLKFLKMWLYPLKDGP